MKKKSNVFVEAGKRGQRNLRKKYSKEEISKINSRNASIRWREWRKKLSTEALA